MSIEDGLKEMKVLIDENVKVSDMRLYYILQGLNDTLESVRYMLQNIQRKHGEL